MAADKPTASEAEEEQSMEEILQSIRRIIAEEDKQAEDGLGHDEDVLELTDIFEAPELQGNEPLSQDPLAAIDALTRPPEPAPPIVMPQPTAYVPPIMQPTPEPAAEPVREPEPAPEPEPEAAWPEPAPPAPTQSLDSLISDQVAQAAASSIKAIRDTAIRAQAPRKAPLAFRSGTTVEDLMLEALRPMLKDWLDSNLPHMVERIITREIHALVEHADDF